MKWKLWLRICCFTGLLAYVAGYLVLWLQQKQEAAPRSDAPGWNIHFSAWETFLIFLILLAPVAYFIWVLWDAVPKGRIGWKGWLTGAVFFAVAAFSLYLQLGILKHDYDAALQSSRFDILNPLAVFEKKKDTTTLPLVSLLCSIMAALMAVTSAVLLILRQRRRPAAVQ